MKTKFWIILLTIAVIIGIVWWRKRSQKSQVTGSNNTSASLSFVSADWASGQAQVDATIKGKKYPLGIQFNVDLKNVQIEGTNYSFGISHDRTTGAELTSVLLRDKNGQVVDEVSIDWVIQAGANTGSGKPTGIEEQEAITINPILIR